MSNKDRPNLLAMLEAIDRINAYVSGISSAEQYHNTPLVFDATLMNFVVLGEMVDRLSPGLKGKHPEVDWPKIKSFRNLVAHDYLGIDAEEVWQILRGDLQSLREDLERLEREISGPPAA